MDLASLQDPVPPPDPLQGSALRAPSRRAIHLLLAAVRRRVALHRLVLAHAARRVPTLIPVRPGVRLRLLARPRAALVRCGTLLVLAGCGAPQWHADAAPEGTALFVDGHQRRDAVVDGRIPYYGVVELAAVPDFELASRDDDPRTTARSKLAIEEPVSPWVFPLDFVLEMLEAPFVDHPVPTAHLVAPLRTDVAIPRTSTPGTEAFLVRARAAATSR